MRIALLTHAFPPDNEHGIPRYVYELADALGKRGHSIEVITGCPETGRARESTDNFNINWVQQGTSFSKHIPALSQLRLSYDIRKTLLKLHKQQPFDTVEFPNYMLSGLFSVFLGLSKPCPAFIIRLSSPGNEIPKSGISPWRLSGLFEKLQTRRLSGIIGNTAENLATCEKVYNLNPKVPRTVILHGLPEGKPPKLHINEPCKNVALFLGRIEHRKGFDTLALAWDLVCQEVQDAKLLVAGKDQPWRGHDSYFKHCLSSISPQAAKHIEYVGFVDTATKESLLSNCDVFVAPSRYESFGLVFLEAMRYGKPVISCRTGGIPNVVDDGSTGMLVKVGDHIALANMIVNLFNDDAKRINLGRRAVSDVETRFSQQRVASESEAFYINCMATKNLRTGPGQ